MSDCGPDEVIVKEQAFYDLRTAAADVARLASPKLATGMEPSAAFRFGVAAQKLTTALDALGAGHIPVDREVMFDD